MAKQDVIKETDTASIEAIHNAISRLGDLPEPPVFTNGHSTISSNADQIADEASAIIKRAAALILDKIEASQHRLDDYRQHLIEETVNAENCIKQTMLSISRIGQAAVEFDKQVDDLIAGKHADSRGAREGRDS